MANRIQKSCSEIIKSVIEHSKIRSRYVNLFALADRLPNSGIGCAFRKKGWPEHKYYILEHVKILPGVWGKKVGKAYGTLHWNFRPISKCEPIPGANTSNKWRYVTKERMEEVKKILDERREHRETVLKIIEQDKQYQQ